MGVRCGHPVVPEVEVSRFILATPPEVERLLRPETLIEYEGTFTVRDVTDTEDGTVVTAGTTGMQIPFRFEKTDSGLAYTQQGEGGPFRVMETAVEIAPQDEGVRITMRSRVELRLPLPFAGRIAAWKRRGELQRALDRLAADLE